MNPSDRAIHVAVGRRYDRVLALLEPDRPWPHVTCSVLPSIHDAFRALHNRPDIDASEMSTAFHLTLVSAGPTPLVAVPVFTSRAFRFGNLYVREDSPLTSIEALRGRTVGLPEYGMTMGVWIRGMFADQFGVRPSDIRWCTGRDPIVTGVPSRVAELGIEVTHIDGGDLWDHLESGEIDVVIGHPPPDRSESVRRLLDDFHSEDLKYFQATGVFPIMHTIVVRRSVCESRPDAVVALVEALCWAKRAAMTGLEDTISYGSTLPFQQSDVGSAKALLGDNWWPYGLEANRCTLETLVRYCFDQGLIERTMPIEELFWSGSHDLVDVA